MNIEIRKLTPDLADDYVTFFDTTPHNEKHKMKCYCVYWCNEDSDDKNFYSKKQEEIMPSNVLKEITYKVILLIVMIRSWDGAMPIRNQIA